ncbi:hypothetical protein IKG33_02410 [Candidatus Saccharibacteria bacterium]|nr:hypothetical protein [Candidatus Saccharibacteria bacterium]
MEERAASSKITPGGAIKQFGDSRLKTAAVFAFIPCFGILGIHNFILKQYKEGIAHIIIVALFYAPYFIINTLCGYDDSDSCSYMNVSFSFLQRLAISSYIWAIIEGVQILKPKTRGKDIKIWSVFSFVATMISVLFWICCLMAMGKSSTDSTGGIGWVLTMYFIDVPLASLAIAFGIVGLKTNWQRLSTVSLIIKAATIIMLLFVYNNLHG